MNKDEQINAIQKVLNDKKNFYLKGKTYPYRDQLKAYGWQWDAYIKTWKIFKKYKKDKCIQDFLGENDVWIEEF